MLRRAGTIAGAMLVRAGSWMLRKSGVAPPVATSQPDEDFEPEGPYEVEISGAGKRLVEEGCVPAPIRLVTASEPPPVGSAAARVRRLRGGL